MTTRYAFIAVDSLQRDQDAHLRRELQHGYWAAKL
jgi:hypothetical protein